MFTVSQERIVYSTQPTRGQEYTDKMDEAYSFMAKFYDAFTFIFPFWKKWIKSVIPFIKGEDILEVSFGPGYLMKQYAKNYRVRGIDYNKDMVALTRKKCSKLVPEENIIEGNVESLPYKDNTFDTVINTMAYTGYPDGKKALKEMLRVLKPQGKLLLVDFDYPENKNIFGYTMVKIMEAGGDIIKNIYEDLKNLPCKTEKKVAGGFGSVYLFIITKS